MGDDVPRRSTRRAGGNPFYLEQLARVRPVRGRRAARAAGAGRCRRRSRPRWPPSSPRSRPTRGACSTRPPSPATRSSPRWRRRSPTCPSRRRCDALDELLARALVRPAGGAAALRVPPPGRAPSRLRRAARRLAARGPRAGRRRAGRRGAGAVDAPTTSRTPRVPGDERRDRAARPRPPRELQGPAPGIAARFHAAALRAAARRAGGADAPRAAAGACSPTPRRRAAIRRPRAADAGRRAARRAPAGERLALTVALANQEWWLGDHEDARRRLHVALGELPGRAITRPRPAPAGPQPDRAAGLRSGRRPRPGARRARRRPRASATPCSSSRRSPPARSPPSARPAGGRRRSAWTPPRPRSSGSTRASSRPVSPAFWMHGRARRLLGRFDAALDDLERGAALAAETGRERVLLVLAVERGAGADRAGPARRRDRRRARTAWSGRAPPATRACCCGR